MSLQYILRKVCQKSGLVITDAANRLLVIDYIQEAVEELYEANDYPGALEEVVLQVFDNITISLPPFVGIPRALREAETLIPWKLSTMRPRYHEKAWPLDAFRNWRDKGIKPYASVITNTAPPLVRVLELDSDPITVTITGPTLNAARVSESKLISALDTQFSTPFTDYYSITKDKISISNVSIIDADDVEISVIYNNELEAAFRIFDVTAYPTIPRNQEQSFFLEVLYKKKLQRLSQDSDTLPIVGYDNVIIDKTLQLIAENDGNIEKAAMFDAKAQRTANRKAADENKGKVMLVDTVTHKHDEVFKRMRWSGRRRFF